MANSNALVSARPSVWVDGRRRDELETSLVALSIRHGEAQVSDCQAEFANWGAARSGATGFLHFGGDVLDFGKRFEIRTGDDVLFLGKILGFEAKFPEMAPPTLVVRADDGLQDLRMTRRTRSFERVSDSDALASIARDHSFRSDITIDGPVHPVLVQSNQTDLEFAQQRARSCDGDLWLEDGTLHCHPRGSRRETGFDLVFQENLRSFSASADLAHQRTALVAGGWDVSSKAAVSERIDEQELSEASSKGRTGPGVLKEAFGERVDALVHAAALDAREAKAEGKARFLAASRRFLRGIGRASCDARLKPARKSELRGLGPAFSGQWDIVQVEHRFDHENGLRTEFVAERAWIGRWA